MKKGTEQSAEVGLANSLRSIASLLAGLEGLKYSNAMNQVSNEQSRVIMDEKKFRAKLDEATHGFPRKHIDRIAGLKKLYPHKISLHGNPNIFERDECFLYAFRDLLPDDLLDAFINLVSDKPELFESICRDLTLKGFVSLHADRMDSDRIVVYFLENTPKHYGRIEGDTVLSKWGSGYAWKHGLFEVPLSYGDNVRFSSGVIDRSVFKMVIETYKEQGKWGQVYV